MVKRLEKGDEMNGAIFGFVIWSLLAAFFIGMGVYACFSTKAVGFWANAQVKEVTDIKRYNFAMAKLFGTYGIVLWVLGLPLLAGQNSPWILVSVLGVMFATITAMIVYTTVIEKKYKKK